MTAAEIRTSLAAPFDRAEIRQRQVGGGKMLDYLPGHVVRRRLNDSTNTWSMKIVRCETRTIRTGGQDVPCEVAEVELTIPELGTRAGLGVQLLRDGSGEDLLKGAVTDALKVAAVNFGVGLQLYDDEAPGPHAVSAPPGGSSRAHAVNGQGGTRQMSPKQFGMINALMREHGYAGQEDDVTMAIAGAPIDDLTTRQASQVIEALQQGFRLQSTGTDTKRTDNGAPAGGEAAGFAHLQRWSDQQKPWVSNILKQTTRRGLTAVHNGIEDAGLGSDKLLRQVLELRGKEVT